MEKMLCDGANEGERKRDFRGNFYMGKRRKVKGENDDVVPADLASRRQQHPLFPGNATLRFLNGDDKAITRCRGFQELQMHAATTLDVYFVDIRVFIQDTYKEILASGCYDEQSYHRGMPPKITTLFFPRERYDDSLWAEILAVHAFYRDRAGVMRAIEEIARALSETQSRPETDAEGETVPLVSIVADALITTITRLNRSLETISQVYVTADDGYVDDTAPLPDDDTAPHEGHIDVMARVDPNHTEGSVEKEGKMMLSLFTEAVHTADWDSYLHRMCGNNPHKFFMLDGCLRKCEAVRLLLSLVPEAFELVDANFGNSILHYIFSSDDRDCTITFDFLRSLRNAEGRRLLTPDLINRLNKNGDSVLEQVVRKKKWALCERLLECGADPNTQNRYSGTALQWACWHRDFVLVEILLKHKADPNVVDFFGRPPIYWAAIEGNVPLVKLLRQYGADIGLADNTGATMIEWAKRRGYAELIRLTEPDIYAH